MLKPVPKWLRVYLISDRKLFSPDAFLLKVEAVLKAGIRSFQLREKDLASRDLLELARKVKGLTHKYGTRLFINDRIDIAHMVSAEGVHLTESSVGAREVKNHFPKLLVGVSTHSLDRAKEAEEEGADFVTFSPIYETASKKEYGPPQGLESLEEVAEALNIPVLALGGIKIGRVPEVLKAGASGVALISDIWNSSNIEHTILEYKAFFGGE